MTRGQSPCVSYFTNKERAATTAELPLFQRNKTLKNMQERSFKLEQACMDLVVGGLETTNSCGRSLAGEIVFDNRQKQQQHYIMSIRYQKLKEEEEGQFDPSVEFGNRAAQSEESVAGPSTEKKFDFEEFHLGTAPAGKIGSPSSQTTNSQPIGDHTFEESRVGEQPVASSRIWNVEYYRFLFNVNTEDVRSRCKRTLKPFPNDFFHHIESNPDLWGPFWISTTLVFTLAAVGNITQWIKFHFNETSGFTWNYNEQKLNVAAFLIYTYMGVIPSLVWAVWKYLQADLGFPNVLCLYGYSMFIYVPVSILCLIPSTFFHWIFNVCGAMASTAFLVLNFYPILSTNKKFGFVLIVLIGVLHFALGSFQVYFFVGQGKLSRLEML
ncbi:hypothetical protein PROFUN_00158 [Planoprotostelium fungivorum]|uniref:Protein YIPF n=1 Tax=Planoprotostelium fungivorum TaxID=1890364 RepID=A0A2P6P0T9_9EUKA|nr:hypothetical protein PROFUN_00158 [Planoprotostelium fungivorum]